MATSIDSTGIHYLLPDPTIMASGDSTAILAEMRAKVIKAQDLDDVANYYRQWFSVEWASRPVGTIITADDHNALRTAILNGASDGWAMAVFPDALPAGSLIKGLTWGRPKTTFTGATYEFTRPGTYQVVVPGGARILQIVQMIAGGGGGGLAFESGHGSSSGSGGSGGYRSNENYTIADRQTITVVVGAGGFGARTSDGNYSRRDWYYGGDPGTYLPVSGGGSTYIVAGGNQIALCTGGGPGQFAPLNPGPPGAGGSPGGNAGAWGSRGRHDDSDGGGANGANSPMGRGGEWGNPWAGNPTGYGAGGASGGWLDRCWPWAWPGTDGSGGYCKFNLLPLPDDVYP